jgi:hypothetical protein
MTIMQKSIRGTWEARDSIELGNDRVLQISTHKVSSGDIVTTATVQLRDGKFLSHRMFTDFSQRMVTAAVRCSEKNVAEQHAACMTKVEELKEAVTAWYVSKGEALPA